MKLIKKRGGIDMLCDNCGKREANVRYSENINGRKKELNLCEECSRKLGIGDMDFSMPIDFSSFFGGFMEEFETPEFMPLLNEVRKLQCDECGYTFDDIVNTGRLGCGKCYEVFQDRLDPIIKKIQGSNTHVGRIGKISDYKVEKNENIKSGENEKNNSNKKKSNKDIENNENKQDRQDNKEKQIEELKEELKQLIKEEKYEEAAKIRDKIKELQ